MKKSIAGVLASALALNSLLMMPMSTFAVDSVTIEAEDAKINGVGEVKTAIKGFTGTGYVDLTDNTAGAPSITFEVDVKEAGAYGLTVRYATSYGSKPIAVTVNGDPAQGGSLDASDSFENFDAGKVNLKAGKNEIVVTASWGWMQLDSITVGEYKAPERPAITASHKALSDPKATKEAQQVFAYLHSVYGKNILSGQQEIYKGGPHDIETEFNYIKEKTGKLPAIRGFDYGNFCCPAFGSDDGSTERVLAWTAQGGLATASFHLNVPTDFASYKIGSRIDWAQTTYSEKTDFSPSKACTEGTKENQYYTQALDTLCEQFAILQNKGITILWRPLHEAEGGGGEGKSWFWWGREGSKAYRDLYQYTYKYMTEKKGLHNLIWEFNSYDFSNSANWYPGDAYVDIIGYDKYNCTDWSTNPPTIVHNTSAETNLFYSMMKRYGNTKMVALMECDSFSTVGTLTEEKAGWLYFMPWYDGGQDNTNFLSNPKFNTVEDLVEMYQSEYCITLDELPDFSKIEVTKETNEVVNTEPTEAKPGHASIATDSKGVTSVDFPEATGTVVLDIDIATNTDANGGLGTSIEYNGKYYWVNVAWKAAKSGEVELELAKNVLNVTEGTDPVEDEALKKGILAKLPSQKSFQFQVWNSTGGKASEVVLKDAYVKKTGTATDPTEPTQEKTEPTTQETTAPTEADPSRKAADVKTNAKGETTITFPAVSDTYYLDVTIPKGATYANGGLGCSVEIDGEYYWANVQWEAKKSGEVAVDPVKNFLNVSLGTETVEDEAIIAAAKKAVAEQKSFQFQAWYTDKGENTDIVLNDAYIKAAATDPTESTKPTEATDPAAKVSVYGDVNGDDEVNIMDVIAFNKFLLGVNQLDAQAQANCDVDKSGKIDSADGLNILKKALEMIELPVK